MQNYLRKVIEKTIDWAVPAVCAAALVVWKDIPADLQHYWPVVCVAIQGLCSLVIAHQNRKEVRRLRAIHEKADAKEADRKAIDDSIQKAFRAMLDDQMGSLYASCVAKGYTTEDERRRSVCRPPTKDAAAMVKRNAARTTLRPSSTKRLGKHNSLTMNNRKDVQP